MRKIIYFCLSIINVIIFSIITTLFLSNGAENIIWLWIWIILSIFFLFFMLYSFCWKWKNTIIYNSIIAILSPLSLMNYATLSSISILIFASLPLTFYYEEEKETKDFFNNNYNNYFMISFIVINNILLNLRESHHNLFVLILSWFNLINVFLLVFWKKIQRKIWIYVIQILVIIYVVLTLKTYLFPFQWEIFWRKIPPYFHLYYVLSSTIILTMFNLFYFHFRNPKFRLK